MGRVEEAIRLYKQATALDPLRANTQLSLGDKLRSVGRYDEAKAALDKAEELNAQLSSLHLTRGQVFLPRATPGRRLRKLRKRPAIGKNSQVKHSPMRPPAVGKSPRLPCKS